MADAPRWVFIDRQLPTIHSAMTAVATEVRARAAELGIEKSTLELVNLRASQINGCAYCLHLHTHLALRAGESPQRIAVLATWRETDLFNRIEKAALNIAEAVSLVSQLRLTEVEYDSMREDLTDDQLALLIYAATTINAFNRVSILSHHPVVERASFGKPIKLG
ncbi:carboxymuconolactone decarboxylase family protein [Tessaracoccus sp. OS52]|uniref:carboxymuconolactone decarboxylase family protein n=1 Tax=Tessaracoccus sp. OS52 TaxID=2886691 RepID=UPI001D1127AA|nr:carboxymuconolactone decarboxylase family protein [Tessaracoccus sp. OS52]MCC2592718.1 carboxymuconolactone decarboxylase family protein [Tessaracoccus sp. OS52]